MRDTPPSNTPLRQWERLGRETVSGIDRALDAVEDFVASILPTAGFERRGFESAVITDKHQSAIVILGESLLDDFAATLGATKPRPYSMGIKNTVYSRVYTALGLQNMMPDVVVSAIILNDERDWHRRVSVHTAFDEKYSKGIYGGLKALESSLRLGFSDELDVPEIRRDIESVKNLADFYDEKKHLNATDVGVENLSFLKAAMLCWIRDLEGKKALEAAPRIRKAFTAQIFEIFESLQHPPWDRIKLPDAVHDFVAQQPQGAPIGAPAADRADIDVLLAKVSPRLVDRRRSAWAVLRSDIEDRVSQATNSMVEVLRSVIVFVRGDKELDEVLKLRYPDQTEFVLRTRAWIAAAKEGLERAKHHNEPQPLNLAEDLMHAAELIIRLLLREPE